MAAAVVIRAPHSEQYGTCGPRCGMRTWRIGWYGLAILICLAMVMLPASAQAQINTGYDLYRACAGSTADTNDAAEAVQRLSCPIYINGFLGALGWMSMLMGQRNTIACIPDSVTAGQASLVFERWAKDHPQWLDRPVAPVLATALNEAWPCH